jgi:predicted secreted protein
MIKKSEKLWIGTKRACLAALLILIASLTGGIAAAAEVAVTEKDTGSTVELVSGDRLNIVLPGNPTTGFNWHVLSVDSAVLKEAGEPSFRRDSDLIGSGGVIMLSFEAAAPGQTTLKITYTRDFEKDVPPLKIYELTVIVKPSQ